VSKKFQRRRGGPDNSGKGINKDTIMQNCIEDGLERTLGLAIYETRGSGTNRDQLGLFWVEGGKGKEDGKQFGKND